MRGLSTLALAGLLCAGPALSSETGSTRTWVSANGVYGIRFVQTGPSACRVEVSREQGAAWTLEQCVGNPGDLYFVSNDGDRFWVIRTLPEKPAPMKPAPVKAKKSKRGRKKEKPLDPLLTAEVATEYDQKGQVVARRQLVELLPPRPDVSDLRQLGRHFQWVEGVGGVPGKGPRLNDAGLVELEPVGQKTQRLKF